MNEQDRIKEKEKNINNSIEQKQKQERGIDIEPQRATNEKTPGI